MTDPTKADDVIDPDRLFPHRGRVTLKAAVLPEGLTRREFVGYTLLIHRDREQLLLVGEMTSRVASTRADQRELAAKMYAAMSALAGQMDLVLTEPVVQVVPGIAEEWSVIVTAGVLDALAAR